MASQRQASQWRDGTGGMMAISPRFLEICSTLVILLALVRAEPRSYEGYLVLQVTPETEDALQLLQQVQGHYTDTVSFWVDPRAIHRNVTLTVDPQVYIELTPQIVNAGMTPVVVTDNLQELIDNEIPEPGDDRNKGGAFNVLQYNTIDQINAYLDSLVGSCDYCELIQIGTSYEGRPLKVLKLSTGDHEKPAIWVDGGIHAREWISPATVLYIIDRMTGRSSHKAMRHMLRYYDWYLMPVVNPDGYAFTWTGDRLWRKTRSPNPGSNCIGTDPNRNWDYHWMEVGASDQPCSETYAGSEAFSEPETAAVADFLLTHQGEFDAFVTIHSYGQYWLTPWGYTSQLPDDYEDLTYVAHKATRTISSLFGTEYTVGSSTNVLYAAAGGSDDWAKGVAGIPYAYTVELQDNGYYGFVLPPSYIEPQGREIWAALRVMSREIYKKRNDFR